ncbi:MAG: STT3 domain-containing protein [Candidatus Odinarchaeota archaeon]
MVKISTSLRNFRDRLKTSVSLKTRNVLFFLAILLIVVLAIAIRLSPLVKGITLIKAFDPWIQWYNAEYLNSHSLYEYFHWIDTKSWYPLGVFRGGLRPGLTFSVVVIHKILNFFGLPISLYDVCFYWPAIMGGLTVLVIYFLGKEILNRPTGLFAAFFLAFNPGYLQRTTAGFFDNETIGVFATLMIFLFYLKAIRTGKFSHSVIGGIFLGYLSLSWGGYQFVYLVIPLISIILILTNKYSENVLISYAGVQGTGLLVFSLYTGFHYSTLYSELDVAGIFFFTIILVFFHIIHTKKNEYPNFYYKLINGIKWGSIPVILILAIILWVSPQILPFGFGSRFWTIINPLFRENVALVASVAEQMPSTWSVFYYNTLIPLILVPLGIYFCFKRLNAADIFLIIFILLMYYFTGSMIRIILLFAPAASLVGAYGLASILKIFGSFIGERKVGVSRKRRRQIKGTLGSSEVLVVYLLVGIMLYAQISHTTNIAINQMSYVQMVPGGQVHDWEETLTWMRTNLHGTDVVASWWDYGYWLTPIANVTTVNDNATRNSTRIGLTGMGFMQTNELYSARAFKRLHADYVLVYWGFLINQLGGDEGKWTWMVQICNNNYEFYKHRGWEEDNWARNSVFDMSNYVNETSGNVEDGWFDSQLMHLLFAGEPTSDTGSLNQLEQNYVNVITNRVDDDGDKWVTHIPDNGYYDSIVFYPIYFSRNHLVKLFKVDYTILDSRFIIRNPIVTDSGYATFKLENTGSKELYIRDVEINNSSYPFFMTDQHVAAGSDALVWVNTTDANFQLDDVVKIQAEAQSEALYQRDYIFTNKTSNFFVRGAEEGEIKINKEKSIVIQKDPSTVDLYLEVENTGGSIVVLDRFYANSDTLENRIDQANITYLSGSSVLEPSDKSLILIKDAKIDFSPIKTYNKIGVATPNNIFDEMLFTSNMENFSLSILDQDRIPSPEELAILNTNYRKNIPVDFDNSYAYTYDNGTIILNMKIKNTGDIIFGLDQVYLTESLIATNFNIIPNNESLNLKSNEERLIRIKIDTTDPINAKYGLSGDINEEILVCITGGFGELGTVASDIGYIHTVKSEPDIKIIKDVQGIKSSFIYANETGQILVKNTGTEPVNLTNIYVNNTLVSNIEYIYGDSSLGIQECAVITFNIPSLKINKSDECIIRVTTTSLVETNATFNAAVDSNYYKINIDDPGTSAVDSGALTILIKNDGIFNVTVDSVYINGTYFSLDSFSSNNGFEIASSGSLQLTIDMAIVESKLGIINVNDILEILVRTIEGAEDIHQETVI